MALCNSYDYNTYPVVLSLLTPRISLKQILTSFQIKVGKTSLTVHDVFALIPLKGIISRPKLILKQHLNLKAPVRVY